MNHIVASRAPYFASVELASSDIFCGDERAPVDTSEPYIHIFGGALFVPYTLCVLEALDRPAPSIDFAKAIAEVIPELTAGGVTGQGVHSDEANEQSKTMQTGRTSGGVGCGFAGKRAVISRLIADQADEVTQEVERLLPSVIANNSDRRLARKLAEAHGRLADQEQIKNDGRANVLAAVAVGAKTMLVSGQHSATTGIINTTPDSTLRTGAALEAGLPAYDHDLWASQELFARLPVNLHLDQHQLAIASLLDIVGTCWALNARDIAVR